MKWKSVLNIRPPEGLHASDNGALHMGLAILFPLTSQPPQPDVYEVRSNKMLEEKEKCMAKRIPDHPSLLLCPKQTLA